MRKRFSSTQRFGLILAIVAGVFFLSAMIVWPVRAAELTFPSLSTPSLFSGQEWKVGQQAGGAITKGVLQFDVSGLSQANAEKHQIFAMFDAAQPSAYGHHGYWIQFRKRAALPLDGPGFQFKLQVDCSWDETKSEIDPAGWDPGKVYHFTFSWDDSSTAVTVQDTATGSNYTAQLPLPAPFKAQDQAIVFGVAGLASSPAFPAEPGAQYSNIVLDAQTVVSDYDDFDGYPECEFDGACGCVTETDPDSAPCSESSSKRPPKPPDEPFSFSRSGLRWNWDKDTIKYFEWGGNNEQDQPEVVIQSASPGAPRGEKASFVASTQNYRTRPNNLYYGWCVLDSVTQQTIVYNSILAGGTAMENSTAEQPIGHGQCCEWQTRTPREDLDDVDGDGQPEGDGMDDNWERGKFIGREINGQRYNSIEEILPGDDPDGDGAVMNRFMNVADSTPVTVVPGLIDSLGNKYYPGGSDGLLTNVEEYILGTDPLNGDTNGDGNGDENSYLGEGQTVLEFTPEQAVGSGYYEVKVATVGLSARQKTYIAVGSQRVYPTVPGKFEIFLSADEKILPVGAADGDEVNIKVNISGGEVNPAALNYQWVFQGENICNPEKHPELSGYCDFNQGQITLGGSGEGAFKNLPGIDLLEPGQDYVIAVRAIDSASRQEASAEIKFKKGTALQLTTVCGDATEENLTVPAGGAGTRRICISDYGVPDLNPAEASFNWYLDGQVDMRQSGIGKDTYDLVATQLIGSRHLVGLEIVYGATLEKELAGSIGIQVVGPRVLIVEPADRLEEKANLPEGSPRVLQAAPGENIAFAAQAIDFGGAQNYRWRWSGGNLSSEQATDFPHSSYNYQVDPEIPFGTVIDISVMVRSSDQQGKIVDAGDSVSILVSSDRGALGAGGGWARGLAALTSVIPIPYRAGFQVLAFLAGGLGAVAAGFYIFRRFTAK